MAAPSPSIDTSSDHLPLLPPPTTSPPPFAPPPPSYYAPTAPPPPPSLTSTPSQRSVRFQSPPADPPRDAPDNHSLLPPYTPRQRQNKYKGHESEADYLAAMRAWAEEKSLMAPGEKSELVGFYGKETMVQCIEKNPRLREGRRKGGRGGGRGGRVGMGMGVGLGRGGWWRVERVREVGRRQGEEGGRVVLGSG